MPSACKVFQNWVSLHCIMNSKCDITYVNGTVEGDYQSEVSLPVR